MMAQSQEEEVQILEHKRKSVSDTFRTKLLFWRTELDQATKSEPSSRKPSRSNLPVPTQQPLNQNSRSEDQNAMEQRGNSTQ